MVKTARRIESNNRLRLRHAYARGRATLPVVVALTLVNRLLLGLGVNYHLLLSAAAPYYLMWTCCRLGVSREIYVAAELLAAALCGVYLVFWQCSRRRRGWLAAALGLYGVDTLLLILFSITILENAASCLLEIVTHIGVLAILAIGDRAASRLSRLPKMRPVSHERIKKVGTDYERKHVGQAFAGVSAEPDPVSPV